jgi:hypothetical protein
VPQDNTLYHLPVSYYIKLTLDVAGSISGNKMGFKYVLTYTNRVNSRVNYLQGSGEKQKLRARIRKASIPYFQVHYGLCFKNC